MKSGQTGPRTRRANSRLCVKLGHSEPPGLNFGIGVEVPSYALERREASVRESGKGRLYHRWVKSSQTGHRIGRANSRPYVKLGHSEPPGLNLLRGFKSLNMLSNVERLAKVRGARAASYSASVPLALGARMRRQDSGPIKGMLGENVPPDLIFIG